MSYAINNPSFTTYKPGNALGARQRGLDTPKKLAGNAATQNNALFLERVAEQTKAGGRFTYLWQQSNTKFKNRLKVEIRGNITTYIPYIYTTL